MFTKAERLPPSFPLLRHKPLSLEILFSHILSPSNKNQAIFNPLVTPSRTSHPNFRHRKTKPRREKVLLCEGFLETFPRNNGRLVAFSRDPCVCPLPEALPGPGCAAPCPSLMDTARFQSSVMWDSWKKDQKSGPKFPSWELGFISSFLPPDWVELGLAVQVIQEIFFPLPVSPRHQWLSSGTTV